MKLASFLDEITQERRRQDDKWGTNRVLPSGVWLAILMEEVGEVAESILENYEGKHHLKNELTQVAAVCAAWAESLDEGT